MHPLGSEIIRGEKRTGTVDKIAVTMGDPSGIGPEVVLKCYLNQKLLKTGVPVVIGDFSVLAEVNNRLGLDLVLKRVSGLGNCANYSNVVPVMDQGVVTDASRVPIGKVSPLGGRAAVTYVRKAVQLAMDNAVVGIATGPIHKEALRSAGSSYIGHTEMLSHMAGVTKSVTMFMVDRLKIFFHTRHMSLKMMLESLDVDGVFRSITMAQRCLESIGYKGGTLALAALNPHGSDGGLFGVEEREILIPACERARKMGIAVEGPVPADSVFHLALQGKFDAVVSLYHDQGHIASKTYDFHRTVSVTLGLPFVRTSVDHGTAFDIAWKGVASQVSMESAIRACFELSRKYRPQLI
jgi:4-hydroxythreonine-4-phosphate dehydrogenase